MTDAWIPPAEFDDYVVVQRIGAGRMGVVYLAEDTVLARHVAVKFIAGREPDVAARQRFLTEARAAARLQHPNVVTIHRVGELHERPYIVTEFIRGKTLEQLDKPLPWKRALEIGIDLSRGLSAAHRKGVLHCDIKCANAVVDDEGTAKLLDFGLATLLQRAGEAAAAAPDAQRGDVVGTPDFMAPEVWRGVAPTRMSDVYGLGAVLYELCSGTLPFAAVAAQDLAAEVQNREAPPLLGVAKDVDDRLAALIDRCLRRDPAERFASGDEVREALETLARNAAGAEVPRGNPYRGLRAFALEDRALFFGRSSDASVLLDRLRAEPIVLVAGDSGVGKSSVCRAGVLPAVLEGALGSARVWSQVTFVLDARPLLALCGALAPLLDVPAAELVAAVRAQPASLAPRLARKLGAGAGLLVFVDQLEELLVLSDDEERGLFAACLSALAANVPGVRILGTLRADFLGRFAALPGLDEILARALYFLRPLSREHMREVIVGPARAAGLGFESEALIDSLADAAAAAEGGLPLLQFALAELWQARDRERNVVTQASLDGLGGVAGALSSHADAVLAALPPPERAAARRIATRLVTLKGTRARRGEPELVQGDAGAKRALDALVRGRLLVARDLEGTSAYELAHEVLLNGWATLRGWLLEDAEGRAARERLGNSAAEWVRLGRARDALWGARQLAEAASLDHAGLQDHELQFVNESRRAVRGAALRKWGAIAGAAGLVAVVYGAVTLKASHDLGARVGRSLAEASGFLASAHEKSQQAAAARTTAFAAFDAFDHVRGEADWAKALALAADAEREHGRASRTLEAAMAQDPGRSDVRALLGDALLERALEADRARKPEQLDELVERLALYDEDGSRLRRWRLPAVIDLTSDPAGAQVSIEREDGTAPRGAPEPLGRTPLSNLSVPPGSVVLSLAAPGRAVVRHALLLGRGQHAKVALDLPPAANVPSGFVYVPPGRFLFGSGDDEGSRRGFFGTVPLHEVSTAGYLISKNEVTYQEWIAFLEELPPAERLKHTPGVPAKVGLSGALQLESTPRGWRLLLQPARDAYSALWGEPIRYLGRKEHAVQDWRRFPVTGISADDAAVYLAWLDRTGRVPKARLCSEHEWERAARGADARPYPHGTHIQPGDANYDETHGKDSLGPDEVGSHPVSRSVFGVDDLSGNAYEWTRSSLALKEVASRGGSFFHDTKTIEVVNRNASIANLRDATLGLRVCADLP